MDDNHVLCFVVHEPPACLGLFVRAGEQKLAIRESSTFALLLKRALCVRELQMRHEAGGGDGAHLIHFVEQEGCGGGAAVLSGSRGRLPRQLPEPDHAIATTRDEQVAARHAGQGRHPVGLVHRDDGRLLAAQTPGPGHGRRAVCLEGEFRFSGVSVPDANHAVVAAACEGLGGEDGAGLDGGEGGRWLEEEVCFLLDSPMTHGGVLASGNEVGGRGVGEGFEAVHVATGKGKRE